MASKKLATDARSQRRAKRAKVKYKQELNQTPKERKYNAGQFTKGNNCYPTSEDRNKSKVDKQVASWVSHHPKRKTLALSIVRNKVKTINKNKKKTDKKHKILRKANKKSTETRKYLLYNKNIIESCLLNENSGKYWIYLHQNIMHKSLDRTILKRQIIEKNNVVCNCVDEPCDPLPGQNQCYHASIGCECNDAICNRWGNACGNRRIQKGIDIEIKVDKNEKGYCVKAEQNISIGTFVIEYTGICIGRQEKEIQEQINNEYMLQVHTDLIINGYGASNEAARVNHDCNANMKQVIWEVNKKKHVIFEAISDIKKGIELTIDYNDAGYCLKGFKCSKSACNKHI